ncbi:hypothetical protein NHQ30_009144 [Ciborinia camelliae]|nr:hypothetical protein NHQ30_009144 [Ciborinia camelliae]
MHRNHKDRYVFSAIILVCGGSLVAFFVTHLHPHNQHQNPAKAVAVGHSSSFNAEKDVGNPVSYFITSSSPATTSSSAQPLATPGNNITSSVDIYSSLTMGTSTTLTAAGVFQSSATPSSNPMSNSTSMSNISRVSTTTLTSAQPLATTDKPFRKFRG